MASSLSKEQKIAVGVVAGVAIPVVVLGVYKREQAKELAAKGYSSFSSGASAAAAKTAEGFKAVQAAASSSYSTAISSATATWDSVAKKLGIASSSKLKRVKSFPIVTDEEDTADVLDQTSKATKKAAKKAGNAQEKAVPVQVMAN